MIMCRLTFHEMVDASGQLPVWCSSAGRLDMKHVFITEVVEIEEHEIKRLATILQ